MTTSHAHLRRTLVALSAATVLALAGCGGDDSEAQTLDTSDSPAASESPSTSESGKPKQSSESPAADEVTVKVSIKGGDVTPVAQAVDLGVGETLVLAIDSDRGGELHVHSTPEQMVEFQSGASRHELTFDKPGSVDIEEHESGALIARVLVK
jgi:hypothetical protein